MISLFQKSPSPDLEKPSFDVEIDQMSFRRANTRLCKRSVFMATLISMVSLLVTMTVIPSAPQFYARLNDLPDKNSDVNQTTTLLTNLREGLHMISFFASDFSLSFENYNLVETIDTFDDHNIYSVSYNWFNKHSLTNGDTTTSRPGLDMFTGLVADIGAQIANVSKSTDPEKVVESVVVTYHHTIMNLEEMYVEAKKTGVYPGHFDEDTLKMGASAHRMKRYSETMKEYPKISIIVSLVSFFILAFVSFRCYKDRVNSFIIILGLVASTGSLLFQMAAWGTELKYYTKLNKLFTTAKLGQMGASYGYHLLQLVVLGCLVSQGLMTYVYVKYRTK